MIERQARYAVYFSPEDETPLATFGWWWLGRSPDTAVFGTLPSVGLVLGRQAEIVADPRRYGFHATLKAPFRLADGTRAEQLVEAIDAFASRHRGFTAPPISLQELDGFLALRPGAPAPDIRSLAADCVRAFDSFRAPASQEETARRLKGGLDERQRKYLAKWGYPFVMDRYRFHLTLTERLADEERALLKSVLAPLVVRFEAVPLEVRSLCLFAQATPSEPFVRVRRFTLAG
jgi:putative phosphonate metabolism protein